MEDLPKSESVRNIKVEKEDGLDSFFPADFMDDPIGYFNREGKNIKKGEKKIDDKGVIRDDPSAVKDLPTWKNEEGQVLDTVGKLVNITKDHVEKSGDPFYEYKILQMLKQLRLSAAKPVASVEQDGAYLILMERIPGLRWHELEDLGLKNIGFLKLEAEQEMGKLEERFKELGIIRKWKLKDMVIQISPDTGHIISVVPTDWERTKVI